MNERHKANIICRFKSHSFSVYNDTDDVYDDDDDDYDSPNGLLRLA